MTSENVHLGEGLWHAVMFSVEVSLRLSFLPEVFAVCARGFHAPRFVSVRRLQLENIFELDTTRVVLRIHMCSGHCQA